VKPAIEARIRELKAEGMGILKIGRTLARSCQRERRRNRCASNLGVRDIGGGWGRAWPIEAQPGCQRQAARACGAQNAPPSMRISGSAN